MFAQSSSAAGVLQELHNASIGGTPVATAHPMNVIGGFRSAIFAGAAALAMACSGEGPAPVGELPESSSRPHVVGGAPATLDELHATVAIWYHDSKFFGCTGTLIASRVVVTAAHCVAMEDDNWNVIGTEAPESLSVVAGVLDVSAPPTQAMHAVAKIVMHPQYGNFGPLDADGLGRDEDIAVLVLDQPVTVQFPVPVLGLARVDEVLKPETPVIVSGYGVTNESTNSDAVLNIAATPFQRRNDAEFLAGRSGLPDSCYGDSGGPAYVDVAGTLHLVGVTSRGSANGNECGSGGIYTLAPGYDDFLKQAADGLYPPPPPPPPPPVPTPDPGTDPAPGAPAGPGATDPSTNRPSAGSQSACTLSRTAPMHSRGFGWLALVGLVALSRRRRARR